MTKSPQMTASSSLPGSPAITPLLRGGYSSAALRNLLWLSADKVVAVVLGLLVFGMIARHFGPGGAGQFSYGVAVLQTTLGLSLCAAHGGAAAFQMLPRHGWGSGRQRTSGWPAA
jgi:hypothetical protein